MADVVVSNGGTPYRRSRKLAVASQLSMFGLQVTLPAIIRLTVGRRDPFVRAWSSEALNLQIIWIGPFLVLAIMLSRTHSQVAGWLAVLGFALIGPYAATCGVIGARKAWRGEVWRYPLNIRLVPGELEDRRPREF